MRAGVSGTLVEANAGYVAAAVRAELRPDFQRRVGPGIGGCRCCSARPNGAWTCLRKSGDRNAWRGNFQIAAIIYRPTQDAQRPGITSHECVAPILPTHGGVPGFSSVL